jgi:DNA-binding GntR family transcriptional regulator
VIRGTRDQISDQLRSAIFTRVYREGEHLSEVSLSRKFGVGRGAIRESLAQLVQEGLLESKPNCGIRVAASPPDFIREVIYPIRRTMETSALKLVFRDLNEDDFRAWEDVVHSMRLACERGDRNGIIKYDIDFHRLLLARTGQPDLLSIWQTIVLRVRAHFWNIIDNYPDLMEFHADHARLLKVLRGGDLKRAMRALEAHIH